jgi:hypothetical protein
LRYRKDNACFFAGLRTKAKGDAGSVAMAVGILRLTNEDLLVKCPRCGRWPMSATSVSPLAPYRVLFTCGNCHEQKSIQVPGRERREAQDTP